MFCSGQAKSVLPMKLKILWLIEVVDLLLDCCNIQLFVSLTAHMFQPWLCGGGLICDQDHLPVATSTCLELRGECSVG